MAIEKKQKAEISSDIYNSAYAELVKLAKKVPRNHSIELKEIAGREHPVLMSILRDYPDSTVIDLGGQPILNIKMK